MSISETGGVHDQGVVSGEPVKRKRGRPRKYKPAEGSAGGSFVDDQGVVTGEPVKRKRGRQRKMVRGRPCVYRSKRSGGCGVTPDINTVSAGEGPLEGLEKPRRRHAKKTTGLSNWVCKSDEDRENAYDRAEELQSSLDPDIPSFVKPILLSHVTGEYCLDLPVEFCKTYMPKHDETITMVNERGEVFLAKYLALKTGLSAGWRGFAIEHELVDGDVLVFQMIKPSRFNVYIIRVNIK